MKTIVVLGGGAAGFFAAITAAATHPQSRVILLEKTNTLLAKVRISGGGRCNVTHACFDPKQLATHYPRGNKALISLFHRFQPKDTIQWFESRGVPLKTEEDGRMFPTTDSSQTIIDCLMREAHKTGVEIHLQQHIEQIDKNLDGFEIRFKNGETLDCNSLLLATGSNKDGFEIAQSFGHSIVPPVPSLFTFNVPAFPLEDLSGISVEHVILKIEGTGLKQEGPLLITHWGFSGPAALKLSAWGARILHGLNYQTTLIVNWAPQYSQQELVAKFLDVKQRNPAQTLMHDTLSLPRNLWKRIVEMADIAPNDRLGDLSNKKLTQFIEKLQANAYTVSGKTTYKQEFVTCGGVNLEEVNFKTMESRLCPGLYFAGEVLDIDGITGGFNFQNAWSTGWVAGQSIG